MLLYILHKFSYENMLKIAYLRILKTEIYIFVALLLYLQYHVCYIKKKLIKYELFLQLIYMLSVNIINFENTKLDLIYGVIRHFIYRNLTQIN